jgi:hypothetical protein
MVPAANKQGLAGNWQRRHVAHRCGRQFQLPERVNTREALRGISLQKLTTDLIEIVRHIHHQITWRRRFLLLLCLQHLVPLSREREAAGQHLEQHDPDAVPITGGRHRLVEALFR